MSARDGRSSYRLADPRLSLNLWRLSWVGDARTEVVAVNSIEPFWTVVFRDRRGALLVDCEPQGFTAGLIFTSEEKAQAFADAMNDISMTVFAAETEVEAFSILKESFLKKGIINAAIDMQITPKKASRFVRVSDLVRAWSSRSKSISPRKIKLTIPDSPVVELEYVTISRDQRVG